jgi:leucyl-tRNA synthetase
MFVAPPEKEVEWSDSGIEGIYRFLGRVWRMVDLVAPAVRGASSARGMALDGPERALRRKTHQTIQRITADIDPRVHLNTAISALMELVNEIYAFGESRGVRPSGRESDPPVVIARAESAAALREAIEALVLMLSPFAPHMCEELWESLGHAGGVVAAGWPVADADAAREEAIEIPVQVNGKVRGRVTVPAEAAERDIEAAALAAPAVQPHLTGRELVKVIVARGRLVSIVVK